MAVIPHRRAGRNLPGSTLAAATILGGPPHDVALAGRTRRTDQPPSPEVRLALDASVASIERRANDLLAEAERLGPPSKTVSSGATADYGGDSQRLPDRLDAAIRRRDGTIEFVEFKSADAVLSENQRLGFADFRKNGGYIAGRGKEGIEGMTVFKTGRIREIKMKREENEVRNIKREQDYYGVARTRYD